MFKVIEIGRGEGLDHSRTGGVATDTKGKESVGRKGFPCSFSADQFNQSLHTETGSPDGEIFSLTHGHFIEDSKGIHKGLVLNSGCSIGSWKEESVDHLKVDFVVLGIKRNG